MLINRGFKYRLYPTSVQEEFFNKCIGCKRFVYNKMLNDKISYYDEYKSQLKVNPADYKDEFPFLKEVDSLALTSAWQDLNTAFTKFFKEPKVGFPKFKSKKRSRKSYTTHNQPKSQAIKLIDGQYIKLPKVGLVKLRYHRSLPDNYEIKFCTISQEPSGKWYISINVEYKKEVPQPKLNKENSLGLDYSSSSFYVDNQGNEANYPKFYRVLEDRLAKEQRKLSRKVLHSNNWWKQYRKVNFIHEKIRNCRKDFLHKLSYNLANHYDYIFVEDINLQNIAQSLKLGKSINDNGFGMFRSFLQYKLKDRGKELIKIDKFYPSSKTCSCCGAYHKDIVSSLSVREWACPDCGTHHNRDVNAAKNIKLEGLNILNRRDCGDSLLILNSDRMLEQEAPKLQLSL